MIIINIFMIKYLEPDFIVYPLIVLLWIVLLIEVIIKNKNRL